MNRVASVVSSPGLPWRIAQLPEARLDLDVPGVIHSLCRTMRCSKRETKVHNHLLQLEDSPYTRTLGEVS